MTTTTQKIPSGYKQTEIGMIPADWNVKKLGDIVQFNNGKAHERFIDDKGDFIVVNSKFISTAGEIFKNSFENLSPLSAGDIAMVMSDIPNGKALAKCFFIEQDGKYTLNQRICAFKSNGADSLYLFYKLNRNKYFLDFDSGVGQTNLKKSEVLDCPVSLPTDKKEQTSIAIALSDTDTLIKKLKKLIDKKKDVKQGAMQELLTGKRRLAGFSGEWKVKTLLEMADNKKEFFDDGDWIEAEYLTDNGIRLIQTGNIGEGCFLEKENKKYISQESFEKLHCKEVKEGDILICRLAEPAGRACIMPNIKGKKVITAVDVTIFRPLEIVADKRFLVNIFSTSSWFNLINEQCGGSTRSRIARGLLGKIKLNLPPVEEQIAIAQIFVDINLEIEKLESQLTKYQNIKQGMMQTLLTGKIRLLTK